MKMIQLKSTYIIIIMLLFYSSNITSQGMMGISCIDNEEYTVLDSAHYRFIYRLTFLQDSTKKKEMTNELVLLVGNKYSKFYNWQYDKKLIVTPEGQSTYSSHGLGGTEIFKNLKTKEMKVFVIPFNNVFCYDDNSTKQDWKIIKETKIINGYACQKAQTVYRGRKYEAWFTPLIPIPNGPWKFGGLPGMILEVADSRGHYSFTCIGLEKLKTPKPIVEYTYKYEKKNRLAVEKIVKNYNENLVQIIESSGAYVQVIGGSKSQKMKFNPIELE